MAGGKKFIDQQDVGYLKDRFCSYARSFHTPDHAYTRNIDLKLQHTLRVCREAAAVGADLGLCRSDLCIAEVAALFHDVGRFEQFRKYRTFSDAQSVNHAAFGVEILRRDGMLSGFDETLQEFIFTIIGRHNLAALPDDADCRTLLFSRLLRDADKLDIWRVVTRYYERKSTGESNEAVELSLPDTPDISPGIYASLLRGEIVRICMMHNLNDFKLLQAGWVYDINFAPALRRLKQRGYLEKLQAALPDTEQVRHIFSRLFSSMEERLEASPAAPALHSVSG